MTCLLTTHSVDKKAQSKNHLNSLAAFSFGDIGAKEKAYKKKSADGEISRSAEREEGVAPPPHKLLKKFDQNFTQLSKAVSLIYSATYAIAAASICAVCSRVIFAIGVIYPPCPVMIPAAPNE